ncbi:hypothetical protein EF294_17410 [Gordonia oryzae]|uniref:Uncharacterized protein n=1 Tax=Gordonia oryzae TaxID=2487349 RepID=A0A3N4G4N2_9ACTN|nr:hypothetical protein EF294_17410 [Gordonia oryzae]
MHMSSRSAGPSNGIAQVGSSAIVCLFLIDPRHTVEIGAGDLQRHRRARAGGNCPEAAVTVSRNLSLTVNDDTDRWRTPRPRRHRGAGLLAHALHGHGDDRCDTLVR